MIVFFLAKDPETGMIIDDGFLPYGASVPSIFASQEKTHWFGERRAREICSSYKLRFIDSDGPYSEALWRLGSRKPKYEENPPPDIPADKWKARLKSTDELKIFRAGLRAGRTKK
jgi:hypothetical protein